jgi:hypothetical protein
VGPSRTEVDHLAALSGLHHAGSLRCEHRVQVDLVHDQRFHELRLRDGGHDFHDWFIGEHGCSLQHRIHIACKPKSAKPVQKWIRE